MIVTERHSHSGLSSFCYCSESEITGIIPGASDLGQVILSEQLL